MDKRTLRTAKPGTPYQEFNGKRFYLYKGESYYTAHEKRMHVYVWEHYNGAVPDGHHIHHKDENKHNNAIENLELIPGSEHIAAHNKAPGSWINSEAGKDHLAAVRPLTKAWHNSEEGKVWHKEHAAASNFGRFDYGVAKCLCCGKEYQKRTKRAKFCGNNCRAQQRRLEGKDTEQRSCMECKQPFTVNRYAASTTCSRSCAAKQRRATKT